MSQLQEERSFGEGLLGEGRWERRSRAEKEEGEGQSSESGTGVI